MYMTIAEEYAVDFEILAILETMEKAAAFEENLKKEDLENREFEHVND